MPPLTGIQDPQGQPRQREGPLAEAPRQTLHRLRAHVPVGEDPLGIADEKPHPVDAVALREQEALLLEEPLRELARQVLGRADLILFAEAREWLPGGPSAATIGGCAASCRAPRGARSSSARSSSAQPSSAQPSSAQPSSAQPSSAQPSSAQPSSAQPSSARPSSAQPSSARPSSARPSSARPSSGAAFFGAAFFGRGLLRRGLLRRGLLRRGLLRRGLLRAAFFGAAFFAARGLLRRGLLRRGLLRRSLLRRSLPGRGLLQRLRRAVGSLPAHAGRTRSSLLLAGHRRAV